MMRSLPPANSRHLRLELAPDVRSVRCARDCVAGVLGNWLLPEDVIETARLLVSELVTNVVQHSLGEARVVVVHEPACLSISVLDQATWSGAASKPDGLAESGRGLLLVAELASRWGSESVGSGTRIWVELDL